MGDNTADTREFITRKEAAAYLTRRWFKISVAGLAKYATAGTGPVYRRRGGRGAALYRRDDLDVWAPEFAGGSAK